MVYITLEVLQGRLRAGFVEQRQRLVARRRLQLQLLLTAERGNFSPITLQVPLRRLECFLRFVQILADVFKLVLEKVERLLRLGQFGTALLEAAGDFVPFVYESNRVQRHEQ